MQVVDRRPDPAELVIHMLYGCHECVDVRRSARIQESVKLCTIILDHLADRGQYMLRLNLVEAG